MPERQLPLEREPGKSLAHQINEIFERRASAGERKLIMQTYQQGFEKLLQTMPKEKQDTSMIKIQRALTKIEGSVHEYGARFADYIRKIFVWPLIAATEDFPKDKFYQIELSRAKAWGEFAATTTKTATAERNTYRDHFLPAAVSIAGTTSTIGAFIGGTFAGIAQGGLTGLGGGIVGAGIGAVAGGVLGGGASLAMRYKDMMLGEPRMFYNLNMTARSGGSGNGISIGGMQAG